MSRPAVHWHTQYQSLRARSEAHDRCMAELTYPSATEVQLRLGPQEDVILAVVRRCAWWTRAEVEGRLPGSSNVTGVLLTAARTEDDTIRRILHHSFKLVFPDDGGEGVVAARLPGVRTRSRIL